MEKFKIGDVVARKSYNFDILFKVVGINNNGIVDLVGLTVRIIADAPDYDLKHINPSEVEKQVANEERSRRARISRCYSSMSKKYNHMREQPAQNDNPYIFKKDTVLRKPGIILHIDGDPEYTDKCRESYRRAGLNAYVYNIAEKDQYKQVYSLLQKIRPNILILTGHRVTSYPMKIVYDLNAYK